MTGKPNKEDTKSINKYVKLAPLLLRGARGVFFFILNPQTNNYHLKCNY
jgi:hypothetical protein